MAALWRVEQAAEYLGIRPKTLYEWVRLGRVPYRKIGFNVRFDPADLQNWTAGQASGEAPTAVPAGAADTGARGGAPRLVELAEEAGASLRELERDAGASLSFPQRRRLLELADELERAVAAARSR